MLYLKQERVNFMDSLKKVFRSSIVTSSILIVLGILLVFYSEFTIMAISYIIGALLIAVGALAIIKFVQNINNNKKNELDIVYGLGTIILGILVIKNHQTIASIIPFVIGIGIIISSSTKLQFAFDLKEQKKQQWKMSMLISIISVACGVILLFNPFKGAVIITQVVGGFIILYGILDITSTIAIKRNMDAIHRAIEGNAKEVEIVEEETIKENISEEFEKKDNNIDKKDKNKKIKNK